MTNKSASLDKRRNGPDACYGILAFIHTKMLKINPIIVAQPKITSVSILTVFIGNVSVIIK